MHKGSVEEHDSIVRRLSDGNLGQHAADCLLCGGRTRKFEKKAAMFESRIQSTRELVEAARIENAGENCVRVRLIPIAQKQNEFLESREDQTW